MNITKKTIANLCNKYLRNIGKAYLDDPEKFFRCVGFHLHYAALSQSFQNAGLLELVQEIDKKLDCPYDCPENLADTNSCEYARLIHSYAIAVIKEFEKNENS